MKEKMRVHYDAEAEFLEIGVGRPSRCYAAEVEPGIFLRRDEKTDEVKSIGVLNFKKRSKSTKNSNLILPVEISFFETSI